MILVACSQTKAPVEDVDAETSTWQEQYDLGVRYLSEGNYEEAIIAFTAAIEIDPKQAPAYVGRGNAYVGSGETEANIATAQMDYKQAIKLDETNAEAYLGLANVYILLNDYDKALEVLNQGLEKTGNNEQLATKIFEIENSSSDDYSKFITDNLISEDEFTIDDIPFYELSLDSAINLLPTSDSTSGILDIHDEAGNIAERQYTVFKNNVGGIISCAQQVSGDMLYSLSFHDYYNKTITVVETGIRDIRTGDTIETVLKKIGISDKGAITLSQTGLSILIGADHRLQGGYGWIETEEQMVTVNGAPAKMINIMMDTCSCQMDFVEDRLVNLQVWVSH